MLSECGVKVMARPEGLEPPAYWFEANRSIQLSYGRVPINTSLAFPDPRRRHARDGAPFDGILVVVHSWSA